MAAEIATRGKDRAEIDRVETEDIEVATNWLIEAYQQLFLNEGCNVEIGLTGSKIQSVAAAALSASIKYSACWYLKPNTYDSKRFTEGFTHTNFFEIKLSKKQEG